MRFLKLKSLINNPSSLRSLESRVISKKVRILIARKPKKKCEVFKKKDNEPI